MIDSIKSTYFIKFIFSNLDKQRKLNLVKYSKRMKNLLNIQLFDYQLFSGKYIEYESNGKWKEYDIYYDHLIYEGEYLNGKRNGKGKEYYNCQLEFEGEYLNGKRQ